MFGNSTIVGITGGTIYFTPSSGNPNTLYYSSLNNPTLSGEILIRSLYYEY